MAPGSDMGLLLEAEVSFTAGWGLLADLVWSLQKFCRAARALWPPSLVTAVTVGSAGLL